MPQLLCRNRVADFQRWKPVFDANRAAAQAAGLDLVQLWQSADDPNDVWFLFQVQSIARAEAFMAAPDAAASAARSGVLDGEYHFLAAPLPS